MDSVSYTTRKLTIRSVAANAELCLETVDQNDSIFKSRPVTLSTPTGCDTDMSDIKLKEKLRITTDAGSTECMITSVRWWIVREADTPVFFCEGCEYLIKSDRSESERDKPYMCPNCYKYMDRVEFVEWLDDDRQKKWYQ